MCSKDASKSGEELVDEWDEVGRQVLDAAGGGGEGEGNRLAGSSENDIVGEGKKTGSV